MRSISAMRSLLLCASSPTFLRSSASALRTPLSSLPFRPDLSCSKLGPARLVTTAGPKARIGGGGSVMDVRAAQSGEIHVIVGPMFAGKTTALLRRVQAEAGTGRTVALVKSDKDNRYGLDSVVTHDGTKMPCWALPKLSSFQDKLGTEAYNKESDGRRRITCCSVVPPPTRRRRSLRQDASDEREDAHRVAGGSARPPPPSATRPVAEGSARMPPASMRRRIARRAALGRRRICHVHLPLRRPPPSSLPGCEPCTEPTIGASSSSQAPPRGIAASRTISAPSSLSQGD